jgi:hypothetical protein
MSYQADQYKKEEYVLLLIGAGNKCKYRSRWDTAYHNLLLLKSKFRELIEE